jgi:2-succinyl-6-hydroxy-2,4-cyclohexadiene-1-carboxylate synthase
VADAVVLLHGFAGTGRGWAPVAARLAARGDDVVAPDLRGHGYAAGRRPVTFAACVADVLAAAPARFALAGYSMGGRLALHVALAAPERVARLVLVSATAGLEDRAERAARRAADEALATRIEAQGLEAFADAWQAQPLFAADPPAVAAAARADQARNRPEGLAAALRGIGAGAMAPLWDRLGLLAMPALALAGERDGRYVALGRRLAAGLPRGQLVVVPGAGHRLVLEAPEAVVHAISGG